jgi:gamma-glutamyltranspeptidase/glutathione hydrolase
VDPGSWESVTVPGAVAAWEALSSRFGRIPFRELFASAIGYAREGFPVSPVVASGWKRAVDRFRKSGDLHKSWFDTFAPAGSPPSAGDIVRLPDHADTLEILASGGSREFYRGTIAEKILSFSAATGGYLSAGDLAEFEPEWVDTIGVPYAGFDVRELPPNGQGLVALVALAILERLKDSPLGRRVEREDGSIAHLQVESIKSAFAACRSLLCDPRFAASEGNGSGIDFGLLSESSIGSLAAAVGGKASAPPKARPDRGGTVYLATADAEGTMVSYIQSNYQGFGSGLVVPGTGIALHDRGLGFSLAEGHPNEMRPGKRPYHTIIPGFLRDASGPVGPFGVMGGFMQPQGHVQLLFHMLEEEQDPQSALDAPRWQWLEGRRLVAEPEYPQAILRRLALRGHEVDIVRDPSIFGRGQAIRRLASGSYVAGCDGRADSVVAAW